jgi:hypothetical protein
VAREPITTPAVPPAPPLAPLLAQLLLPTATLLVLLVVPPCATSPTLDLAALAGLALWTGWTLARCLGRSRRRSGPPGLPVASPPSPEVTSSPGGAD